MLPHRFKSSWTYLKPLICSRLTVNTLSERVIVDGRGLRAACRSVTSRPSVSNRACRLSSVLEAQCSASAGLIPGPIPYYYPIYNQNGPTRNENKLQPH